MNLILSPSYGCYCYLRSFVFAIVIKIENILFNKLNKATNQSFRKCNKKKKKIKQGRMQNPGKLEKYLEFERTLEIVINLLIKLYIQIIFYGIK